MPAKFTNVNNSGRAKFTNVNNSGRAVFGEVSTGTTTTTTTLPVYNYVYTISFARVTGNLRANLTFDSTTDPSNVSGATVSAIATPLKYTLASCAGTPAGGAPQTTTTINAGASVGASSTAVSEAIGSTLSVRLIGDTSLNFAGTAINSSPQTVVIGGHNYIINGFNQCYPTN
jgi:hypothetical protein